MTWTEPRAFPLDPDTGLLRGTGTSYAKRLRDLEGLYADAVAFEALAAGRGDEVVYEVTDHRPSEAAGDVITGTTRMSPGRVGDEFFMTRGHLHAIPDRPEMYFGLAGRGLMLMESPDGRPSVVEIRPGTVCYVPPFWIHRSINVGDEDFAMLFCYPADAGQDYEIIRRSNGLARRVVADGDGGWASVPNLDYAPRGADEVAAFEAQRRLRRGRG